MNKIKFFVIAHNIRSLHNVGSIFRTADAFGISKIFLTGHTGTPPDPKIAKVALGAERFVPWEYQHTVAGVIKQLRAKHPKVSILGLENNLPAKYRRRVMYLNRFKPTFPLALIIGEETKGIPKSILKYCDKFLEIPMRGKKESLNVSVAFGVAVGYIMNV